MYDPQTRQFQPERQCFEPIGDVLLPGRPLNHVQKRLMLLPIPRLVMIPQELSRMQKVRGHPRDRIEFAIAQNTLGRARVDHAPNEIHRLQLLRSAINQVSYKYRCAISVTPNAVGCRIAEMVKEPRKLIELPVHIADDIESHGLLLVSGPCRHSLTDPADHIRISSGNSPTIPAQRIRFRADGECSVE